MSPRVAIVATHCSLQQGGEAALPFHYYRVLRARGHDVHLVVHARTQDELLAAFPTDHERIHFVADDPLDVLLWQLGRPLPSRVDLMTLRLLDDLYTQRRQRRVVRRLVAEGRVDLVHQPGPVSPAAPSLMHSVGVPVVIGPMNGGIDFAPGLRRRERRLERWATAVARTVRTPAARLLPGKRRARVLLVANERTRSGLPGGLAGEVLRLPENGVDATVWRPGPVERPPRFAFVGRLVDWKGADLLLRAWARRPASDAVLEVIGDGPERPRLEALARDAGVAARVRFLGWLPQEQCAARLRGAQALVLPSLRECGGAVVLEAMASGIPSIAVAWGGPADYLDGATGILIHPGPEARVIAELVAAMTRIEKDPALRERLGRAARERVLAEYDWEAKVDRILDVYRRALAGGEAAPAPPGRAEVPA